MAERFYSDEQAQEILQMAVRTSSGSGGVTQAQLLETAAELGIRPEDVLQAESAYLERQQIKLDQRAFRHARRKQYLQDISGVLTAAVLLTGIVLVLRGGVLTGSFTFPTWIKWPLGLMAFVLVKNTVEFGMDLTLHREAAFEKWRRKQQKQVRKAEEKALSRDVEIDGSSVDQNQATQRLSG